MKTQISAKVVGVYDLEPILFGDEGRYSVAVRIEIVQVLATGRFRAKILRFESYRLQSTFPQVDGEPTEGLSDEVLLVDDETILGQKADTDYATIDNALNA